MKMKKIFRHIQFGLVLLPLSFAACSLDETNPGGFTMDNVAQTKDGFQALVNQCYFAFERYFDGSANWVHMTEGNTDLWTSQANDASSSKEWFWFDGTNINYTANYWNGTYDGIGSCNSVIERARLAPLTGAPGVSSGFSQAELDNMVAQARFMRAIYYFNAVRLWGGITMITDLQTSETITYAPERASQMDIYKNIIIPADTDIYGALLHNLII